MWQCVEDKRPLLMEQLPINGGCGQSFGFVLYRKHVAEPKKLMFPGKVRDRAVVSQLLTLLFYHTHKLLLFHMIDIHCVSKKHVTTSSTIS